MALNDVWAVSILGQVTGVNWANTMLLKQVSADGVGDPWDEASDTLLQNLWVDELLPILGDALTITGRRVRRFAPLPGPGFFFAESEVGGVSSPALPSVSAAVISLQTDVSHARARGRIKLAGVVKADVVDGRLTASSFSAFESAVAPLLSSMTLGGGAASFRAGLETGVIGGFQGFTLSQVRARMKTQRSRQSSS